MRSGTARATQEVAMFASYITEELARQHIAELIAEADQARLAAHARRATVRASLARMITRSADDRRTPCATAPAGLVLGEADHAAVHLGRRRRAGAAPSPRPAAAARQAVLRTAGPAWGDWTLSRRTWKTL